MTSHSGWSDSLLQILLLFQMLNIGTLQKFIEIANQSSGGEFFKIKAEEGDRFSSF